MVSRQFGTALLFAGLLASAPLASSAADAAYLDGKPVTLVCSTSPGSGAGTWCQMMAEELQKPGRLGVPVIVVYKPGGSSNEAAVYTHSKPADGHTVMHIDGSYSGYFNLPFFTYKFDAFKIVARVERHVYVVAARCDNPNLRTWSDVVAYAKAHPGDLSMGSGKIGSLQHRNSVQINEAAGVNIRFIPYGGTGGVVKDVVGGHLPLGMAQPGLWAQHVQAGTICPLFVENEERLKQPLWAKTPTAKEVGLNYHILHQWQGFAVRKETPDNVVNTFVDAVQKVTESDGYKAYLAQSPHVIPDFSRNQSKLSSEFIDDIKNAKTFMVNNKIIPKS